MVSASWHRTALFVLAFLVTANAVQAKPYRIVFLGDSITDGHIYPALARQAVAEAGKPVPLCLNAGIGGDTAKGMRKRLDRDVLPLHPDLVTLSAGINDVLHKVDPAAYQADVDAIAARLKKEGIPLIILTTSVLGRKRHATADDRLADFNAALRRVARKYGCKVAEVNERMQAARKDGVTLLDEDEVHPNFEGHRLMARAVLNALGYPATKVPKKLKAEPWPGLVRDWRIRPVGDKEAQLTDARAAALKPDDTWKPYHLPEKVAVKGWWNKLEQQRGFAMALPEVVGKAKKYQGIAYLDKKEGGKVYFNPAANLETIWLNGKRIYRAAPEWRGWHVGRERIPAELRPGRNMIVIETGGPFLLSVTKDKDG